MDRKLDIDSMDNDFLRIAGNLDVIKENSKSIYAASPVYGWVYKIEKKTGKVFRDGKQIAETSQWHLF